MLITSWSFIDGLHVTVTGFGIKWDSWDTLRYNCRRSMKLVEIFESCLLLLLPTHTCRDARGDPVLDQIYVQALERSKCEIECSWGCNTSFIQNVGLDLVPMFIHDVLNISRMHVFMYSITCMMESLFRNRSQLVMLGDIGFEFYGH